MFFIRVYMSNYKLLLKFINLNDYKIDLRKNIEKKLLLPNNNFNFKNINFDKNNLKDENLYISYNKYPYYDQDKLENNINTFVNNNKNKDIRIPYDIFYDINNKDILNDFNKFLEEKYKNTEIISTGNDKITNIIKNYMNDLKKYISSSKDDQSVDINKYITFYNINFLLKNYFFKNNNFIDLFKFNLNSSDSSDPTRFYIEGFDYIEPRSSKNNYFIINENNKTISLTIKINLKEKKFTNQLVIKLSIKGDIQSDKYTAKEKEIQKKIIKNEYNYKNKSINDETINKILEKKKYIEFSPSDISSNYNKYKDIYLNTDYEITNNIFLDYINKNKINDKLSVFFDLSQNNDFNKYLKQQYILQNSNKNYYDSSRKLKKLNINTLLFSPINKSEIQYYNSIIAKINNMKDKNDYIVGISNNIKLILKYLINNHIYIDNKKYHIINSYVNMSNNNIIYDFYRSISNTTFVTDNIYEITLNLDLLDAKKNNNLLNRKKVNCKINKKNLVDNFESNNISKNKVINYLFDIIIKPNTSKNLQGGYMKKYKNKTKKYNKNKLKNKKYTHKKYNKSKTKKKLKYSKI